MAVRERDQNPVVGSTIRLRLFTFNSKLPTDVESVSQVDVYYLDPFGVTDDNPDGRVLVTTIASGSVVHVTDGQYYADLELSSPAYGVGKYLDVWSVYTNSTSEPLETFEKRFDIFSDAWYATTKPVVYDFNFRFQPNKISIGSKRPVRIEIIPSVPTGIVLDEYYTNLAIISTLRVSIAKKCGNVCGPTDDDEALLVDEELVEYSDKVFGYYTIDTTDDSEYDFSCGVYDIWFKLEVGGNVYISPKQQFMIYN